MNTNGSSRALLISLLAFAAQAQAAQPATDRATVERGRYIAITSGCNDCHTPGYMQTDGNVPEPLWLTGNELGFKGPWGTSYPVNLRLYVQQISEADWIKRVREPMRPPMPWFNLRDMEDADLSALYRYLRAIGPAGTPAPAAVAPGIEVATPYIDFTPRNLPEPNAAAHPDAPGRLAAH